MLTARADFDDKHTVLKTFHDYGIDMSRIHLYRAGNIPGDNPPALKKAVYVRKFLSSGEYDRVSLYDDSTSNLKAFKASCTVSNITHFFLEVTVQYILLKYQIQY